MTNYDLYDAIISVKEATEHFARRTATDFQAVNGRLDRVEGRLDRVETQLRRLEKRIESVEDGQRATRADIAELQHRSR